MIVHGQRFIEIFLKLDNGSVQFSLVAQSCPTLCNPMNHSTPGLGGNKEILVSDHIGLFFILLCTGWAGRQKKLGEI